MTNELILDVAKRVGAFAPQFIDLVKDAGAHAKAGLRVGLLERSQRCLGGVEHHAGPTSLDLAEHAMFDRIPLRGVGRTVSDAQTHAEALGEPDEVFLEAQGARGIGAAAIEEQHQFGGIRVARSEATCQASSMASQTKALVSRERPSVRKARLCTLS